MVDQSAPVSGGTSACDVPNPYADNVCKRCVRNLHLVKMHHRNVVEKTKFSQYFGEHRTITHKIFIDKLNSVSWMPDQIQCILPLTMSANDAPETCIM